MAISNATYASAGQVQRLRSNRPLETVSRAMGIHVPTSLSPAKLAMDVKTDVVASIPFDALFTSQEYRRGELTAKEYVAKTLSTSVSSVAWTVGGAMMGALLAPAGLPALMVGIAGFATGLVATTIWDRTVGKPITEALETVIPEALAEPVAEVFTKAIANPLYDAVWKPLTEVVKPAFRWAMQNKVTAGAALGGLALLFPKAAKAIAPEVLTMAGGMAAGIAFTGKVIDPILPPADEKAEAPAKAAKASGAGQAAGLHFARSR
jgi:hypothetical protein